MNFNIFPSVSSPLSYGVFSVAVSWRGLVLVLGGVGAVDGGAGVVVRLIGVPALGSFALGGGVRVSCLLGVKTGVGALLSLPMGFLVALLLVWALEAMLRRRWS